MSSEEREHRQPAERWVRFHSLPESKRYAQTPAEHAEVLRRYHVLLDDLLAGASRSDLLITGSERTDLDELLTEIADDRVWGVVLSVPGKAWRFHPYDGGVDIIAESTGHRDALAARYSAWLSQHPAGL